MPVLRDATIDVDSANTIEKDLNSLFKALVKVGQVISEDEDLTQMFYTSAMGIMSQEEEKGARKDVEEEEEEEEEGDKKKNKNKNKSKNKKEEEPDLDAETSKLK